MDEMYVLLTFLLFIFIFFITRPFAILLHELGHAIPMLLMTRQKVSVYIGSNGDPAKSLHLSIGPLDIWIKYNPFLWMRGVCVPHAKSIAVNRQVIYIICGPLASLLVGILSAWLLFAFDLHGAIKLMLIILLGSAIFDFLVSAIPMKNIRNDAHLLLELARYDKFKKQHDAVMKLYDENECEKARDLVMEYIKKGIGNEHIFRLAMVMHSATNEYEKAVEFYGILEKQYTLNTNDYCTLALVKGYMGLQEECLQAFNNSLALDPNNFYSLNNRGCFLNEWNRFEEAIPDLEKAIAINPGFSHSYANRGLARIKTGDEENGLADINKAMQLEPGNAYAYRSMGIYYMHIGQPKKAIESFYKARELYKYTHKIDELIAEAETC